MTVILHKILIFFRPKTNSKTKGVQTSALLLELHLWTQLSYPKCEIACRSSQGRDTFSAPGFFSSRVLNSPNFQDGIAEFLLCDSGSLVSKESLSNSSEFSGKCVKITIGDSPSNPYQSSAIDRDIEYMLRLMITFECRH